MDDVDDWGEETSKKRDGWPADPYRIRRALWNGKRWLVGVSVAGVLVGLFWAKVMMPPLYMTTVVLKHEGTVPLAGYQLNTGHSLTAGAEALHRESVLRRIRERMGVDWSLISIAEQLDYRFDRRAGTMEIDVYESSAEGAAEFALLITDVFLTYHAERQARRIELELDRVAKRIEAAENEAAEARRLYNAFREQHGIANLSSEQRSTVDSAAKLRSDSEFAAAEIRALEAQVASLEEQRARTPKTSVLTTGTSPERDAYNQLRQELASARASLSPDHPRVQSLELQVQRLGTELRGGGGDGLIGSNSTYAAISDELRSAKAALAAARERQKGLSRLADAAQRRVESFSGIEGEASSLLTEVEVSEALLGHLRGVQAALEDSLEDPPSGFSVLDPGAVPELPERDTMKLVIFAALSALGVLVGLSIALWREFRGLRVQTPSEVAFWGRGPVLGATPWPNDPRGLDELVAGLDDLAPEARGDLLVVGGTPKDSSLAHELARGMMDDWFVDEPSAHSPSVARAAPSPGPLTTPPPPPSGPYPVGGAQRQSAAPAAPSTSLALRPVQLVRRDADLRLEAWEGPFEDQALRRAARLADRVIVLVRSGAMTAFSLDGVRRRIGRDTGIGYVVVGLPDDLRALPDRIGKVAEFWRG